MAWFEAMAALKMQYEQFGTGKPIDDFVLLVEGPTDESFIEKLEIKNLKCFAIGLLNGANNRIEEERKKFIDAFKICLKDNQIDLNTDKSNKNFIKETVEKLKSFYLFEKLIKLYGLIDRDFSSRLSNGNILVTPTHDLETLLLSTDEKIFPKEMNKYFNDALYLAYLIGKVKKHLQNKGYVLPTDCNLEEVIEIQKKEIKLPNLMKLIVKSKYRKENQQSEKPTLEELKSEINKGIKLFAKDEINYYNIANGHDILNIMRLLCETEMNQFIKNQDAQKYKSQIEHAVINKYNLKKFKRTFLYDDMKSRNLTPTAIK